VTEVEAETVLVVTVKDALLEPAGMVTLAGTVATPVLLLERVTVTPPDGAAPLSVTTPVEELPPETLAGLSDTRLNVMAVGAESTSSVFERVTPP
jgi:hypothetical protein